jgi:hypothetical protein
MNDQNTLLIKKGRVEDCLEQYKPTMMLSGIPARQPEEPAVT